MNLNWSKLRPHVREAKFKEGVMHLEFCCLLMDLQISEGRKVVFEHPQSSLSWQSPRLTEISELPNIQKINFDMCQFGLTSPVEQIPLRKPTTILTNLPQLCVKLMDKKCKGGHKHKAIRGSEGHIQLSTWAQRYPQQLVEAIASSVAEQVHFIG